VNRPLGLVKEPLGARRPAIGDQPLAGRDDFDHLERVPAEHQHVAIQSGLEAALSRQGLANR